MPRSEIRESITNSATGQGVNGARVEVRLRGLATLATVYAAASGSTQIANPLFSTKGMITGWLENGSYDLVITGARLQPSTVPIEAWNGSTVAGVVDGSVTNASVAANAGISYTKLNLVGSIQVTDLGFAVPDTSGSVIINPATSARNVVSPTGSAIVPIILRGVVGQTADLQQWQDSLGAIRLRVTSSGSLLGQDGFKFGPTGGTADPLPGVRYGIAGQDTNVPTFVLQAFTSQTADIQQWRNSAGTVLSRIEADGKIAHGVGTDGQVTIGDAGIYFGSDFAARLVRAGSGSIEAVSRLIVRTNLPALNPLIVKGAPSQTANLQEWRNSADSTLSYVNAAGIIVAPSFYGDLFIGGGAGNVSHDGATNTVRVSAYEGASLGIDVSTPVLRVARDSDGVSNRPSVLITGRAMIRSVNNAQDALQIQDAGGAILTTVDAGGHIVTGSQLRLTDTAASGARIIFGGDTNIWRETGQLLFVTNLAAGTLTGRFQVLADGTSGNPGTVKLIAKGSASQTADLQQWQNSAGGVLAYVSSNGAFLVPGLNTNNIELGAGGAGFVRNGGTGEFTYTTQAVSGANHRFALAHAAQSVIIRAAASHTAALQEWQDSASGPVAAILANNRIRSYRSGVAGAYIDVFHDGVPKITASSNSQIEFPDGLNGGLTIGNIFLGAGATSLNIQASGVSGTALIIKGIASQTGDFQRWQTSTAVVLASVTAAGLHKWNAAANTQTTVGAAGAASALPATPSKYLKVVGDDGVTYVVPAYAAS